MLNHVLMPQSDHVSLIFPVIPVMEMPIADLITRPETMANADQNKELNTVCK